jgi:transposase
LDRLIRRIAKTREIPLSRIYVCYEAGGCGMWIARMLMQMKVHCTVIAPSLIPTKSGDYVKTDNKDAVKPVRLHRAGELVSVYVPDETDEEVRDLCRARVDAIDDRRRAKTRLLAMLRRLVLNYTGKTTWNDVHKRYLRHLSLSIPAHRVILEELIDQIEWWHRRPCSPNSTRTSTPVAAHVLLLVFFCFDALTQPNLDDGLTCNSNQ